MKLVVDGANMRTGLTEGRRVAACGGPVVRGVSCRLRRPVRRKRRPYRMRDAHGFPSFAKATEGSSGCCAAGEG